MRVLLIEDDSATAQSIELMLKTENFNIYATDLGEEGVDLGKLYDYDIILLDLNLPDMSGYEVLRTLRVARVKTPNLILSGLAGIEDKVRGLGFGADDYLTKDISFAHLLARIAALFRRMQAMQEQAPAEEALERDGLRIDLKRFAVSWKGRPVELTLTEFWIVHSLARHPGHVKNREQLMRDAELVVDDATITSHVKRLRAKFVASDPAFAAIETAYGLGYRWKA